MQITPAEQKLWPWQLRLQRKNRTAGERILILIKRLIILGIGIGLPTGTIALFPYVDEAITGLFGTGFWAIVLIPAAKGSLLLLVVLSGVAYMSLAERRFAGLIQLRYGPNRVGWFGFLQPLADGIKFFFKEDVVPENVHKPLYILAPIIIMVPAITVFCVIPFGPGEAGANPYQIASVNIGLLLILGLSSLGIYGIALGGWASFSKWSLLGGLRAGAQMISYEVCLAMSIVGVLIYAGSFDITAIVKSQSGTIFGFLPAWNLFPQVGGFIVFLVAMFAETNRLPFDMAEAEQELVGGYHTEYSSMKFALFFLAEYANMITAAALITLLFLGGWHMPGLASLGLPPAIEAVAQIFAFLLKVFLLLFLFIWARWTLPRFRYDQVMGLGWKLLLPVALGNVILTAVLVAFA